MLKPLQKTMLFHTSYCSSWKWQQPWRPFNNDEALEILRVTSTATSPQSLGVINGFSGFMQTIASNRTRAKTGCEKKCNWAVQNVSWQKLSSNSVNFHPFNFFEVLILCYDCVRTIEKALQSWLILYLAKYRYAIMRRVKLGPMPKLSCLNMSSCEHIEASFLGEIYCMNPSPHIQLYKPKYKNTSQSCI